MRRAWQVLAFALASCGGPTLALAQQVALAPDSLTLAVGDTSRVVATLTGGAGLRLSFRGTNATAFTVHRDGRITARAVGCGYVRVGVVDSTWTRAQVRVCVTAAAPTPTPDPTPDPDPTPTPTPGALIFASDWSSGSVNDGGRWNNTYCPGTLVAQTLAVVDGAPLGWTKTPKVLRLRQLGESVCGMLEKTNAVPVSTSHYGRFYFRNDETSTTHNHVATYNPVGDIQVAIWNRDASAAGLTLFFRTYKSPAGDFAGWPYSYWRLPTRLQHGTWYRYEWHMEYVTATTYRLWPRVYDLAGTLIADANTYRDSDGGRTLAAHYASGATFGVNPTLARNFGLGNEGPAQSANTGGYWYHADVALSLTDWIGR